MNYGEAQQEQDARLFEAQVKEVLQSTTSEETLKTYDIYGFYSETSGGPTVSINGFKFYPDTMEALHKKFSIGIIEARKTRFHLGFRKRNVSVIHFFVYPKESTA